MNIIIAGAGKVGFNLAKTLSIKHNVTVIDINSEALYAIQENLDILTLKGNVEDSQTYQKFSKQEIDFFIAVTNIDNVNLLATFIADTVLHVKKKFVRLQKDFYANELIKERFNIDHMIFPIKLASKTIVSLLDYPRANNVKFFKYTDYKLISVRITTSTALTASFLLNIVAIEREKQFFIYKNENLEIGDLVYFLGLDEEIEVACETLNGIETPQIRRCVVFGGEELGIAIAKDLSDTARDVKLIEKDILLCKEADEILEGKVSIINSKYGDTEIFKDEGLDSADLFIAATNNDEYNIIKCLEAQEKGVQKVLAINNEIEYYSLMHSLGIIVARGPKMSAYNTIIGDISSNNVVIQKSFCGAMGIMFIRKIFSESKLIDKKIKPPSFKEATIFYIREEKLYVLNEKISLLEKDIIMVFSVSNKSAKVKQWIYEL